MDVAYTIGKRSRCSRAQIGAVIVSKDQRIVATGYNGPAANWPKQDDCVEWCPRAQGLTPLDNTYDACPSIHSEANALLFVDRSVVEGATIYVTGACCMQCAKLISNSGITHVRMIIRETDRHRNPENVIAYLLTCNIDVVTIEDEID
jgi:dCMP deaminase